MTFATRWIAAFRPVRATTAVALLMAAASMATAPATARAGSITYTTGNGATTGGGPVDATAVFTLGNGVINITLTNYEQNPKADSQLITGLTFSVSGLTGVTGYTGTGDTSTLTAASHGGKGYTYSAGVSSTIADSVSNPNSKYEPWQASKTGPTSVNLTALTGGQPFDLIIGPDSAGGFDPTKGSYSNANNSIFNHSPVVLGTATFTIDVSGVTSSSKLSDVTFQFGTQAGSNTAIGVLSVPEPSTMVMGLSATAMVAGLVARRRRRAA